jgi:hypothetical protein
MDEWGIFKHLPEDLTCFTGDLRSRYEIVAFSKFCRRFVTLDILPVERCLQFTFPRPPECSYFGIYKKYVTCADQSIKILLSWSEIIFINISLNDSIIPEVQYFNLQTKVFPESWKSITCEADGNHVEVFRYGLCNQQRRLSSITDLMIEPWLSDLPEIGRRILPVTIVCIIEFHCFRSLMLDGFVHGQTR